MNSELREIRGAQSREGLLEVTRRAHHAECVICGPGHPSGLRLQFRMRKPGQVYTFFSCSRVFQGYPAMLHGGITAAIIDDAMANCLFSLGVAGITGDLMVRYERPVRVGGSAEVRADFVRGCDPVYHVAAELWQDGVLCVRATARFADERWAAESWGLQTASVGTA